MSEGEARGLFTRYMTIDLFPMIFYDFAETMEFIIIQLASSYDRFILINIFYIHEKCSVISLKNHGEFNLGYKTPSIFNPLKQLVN